MPSIFISYRRDDTAGVAGRLAEHLIGRFGRSSVFIDIDTIEPGVDFEQRIHHALESCAVALVLIGDEWLGAALPDGRRRLDDPGDYVRQEIATALTRADVEVVPVLVDGAAMPRPDELPGDLAPLARINAFELSNRRWRYDAEQLTRLAARHDRWWRRSVSAVPRWVVRSGLAFALAGALTAGVVLATSGSAGTTGGGAGGGGRTHHAGGGGSAQRAILAPATVAPEVDECTQQLQFGADGTAGPVKCANGDLNVLAWRYYATDRPQVMTLGRFASPTQVQAAVCADARTPAIGTNPRADDAYALAALYYGWRFAITPDATSC